MNVANSGIFEKEYFFNFNADLAPNTWYEIEIIVDPASLSGQSVGLYSPIQFHTVSDGFSNSNRIIYDTNPVFAVFQLAPVPPTTLVKIINLLKKKIFYKKGLYTIYLLMEKKIGIVH